MGSQSSVLDLLEDRIRRVRLIAFALAALVSVLTGGYLFLALKDIEDATLQRVTLYSRVLESETTNLVEGAASLLTSVGDTVQFQQAEVDPVLTTRLLKDSLTGHRTLRSLSLVDPQGRVLASTNAANVDQRINLSRLGTIVGDDRVRMGPYLPGRDLAGSGNEPSGVGTLPLVRRIERSGKEGLLLVGLLNIDRFATQYGVLIGDVAERSALFSFAGQVLLSGSMMPLEPGSRGDQLTPFTRFLPVREHGSFIGAGVDGNPSLSAFRTLRQWPLVTLVEVPYAAVWRDWMTRLWWALGALGLTLAAIAVVARLLVRDHRRQAAAQADVELAHAEVSRMEERWKMALEGADHAVWELDLRNGHAVVSERLPRWLGYDPKETVWGLDRWGEIVHPEDIEAAVRAMERHLAGRSPGFDVEIRLRTHDGHWRWIQARARATPERDQTGRPVRLLGTCNDITARKTAESSLRASQARQQAILDSSLDAIVIIDDHDQIVDFNAAAEALFGYQLVEILGQPMHQLIVPPAHRAAHAEGLRRYREGGPAPILNKRREIEAMRADGSVFPAEITVVAVQTSEGELFTATLRDITQRQAVERALRDSESRFRATFEQTAVGVLHQAADRRLLRANQTLCDMLGYTREELLSIPLIDFIHPDDVAVGLDGMRQLFLGLIPVFRQDKRYRTKSGAYLWCRMTASVARDAQGQPQYMICVIEDISEFRQAQADLAEARMREIEVGARIQQSLLLTPPLENVAGVCASTFSQASGGIDGDFFDMIRVTDDVVDIIAGDVMGKGIPAALLGAGTKLQFSRSMAELLAQRDPSEGLPSPSQIVTAVNRQMTPHLRDLEAFVTLIYVRVDMRDDTLTWVGCGHEEALLVDHRRNRHLLGNQHPPMGLFENEVFTEDQHPMGPGDSLFLCSDGATEAVLPNGERVGRERVHDAVARHNELSCTPAMALHGVRRELLNQGVMLTDDLTLAMIVRHDRLHAMERIELPIRLTALDTLRRFVTQQCHGAEVSEDRSANFVVAAVEVMTNVIRHATGLLPAAPVELIAELTGPGALALQFRYFGDPFVPPSGRQVPEIESEDPTHLPEGGYGLHIIEQTCDEVRYSADQGINTVHIALNTEAAVVDEAAAVPGRD